MKADYSIDEEDGDDVNQLVKIHDEERLQKVIERDRDRRRVSEIQREIEKETETEICEE